MKPLNYTKQEKCLGDKKSSFADLDKVKGSFGHMRAGQGQGSIRKGSIDACSASHSKKRASGLIEKNITRRMKSGNREGGLKTKESGLPSEREQFWVNVPSKGG